MQQRFFWVLNSLPVQDCNMCLVEICQINTVTKETISDILGKKSTWDNWNLHSNCCCFILLRVGYWRAFHRQGSRWGYRFLGRIRDFGKGVPVHTYTDIFENGGFFLPFSKKSVSTRSVFKLFLAVYTYLDIFENGGVFSLRSHVAFSNRFCLPAIFDVIVFENLHFHLSTRLHKIPG